jgi:hypothetical protein
MFSRHWLEFAPGPKASPKSSEMRSSHQKQFLEIAHVIEMFYRVT